MNRTNAVSVGEVLRTIFQENKFFHEKYIETRTKESWKDVMGSGIMRYTSSVNVRNRTMFVTLRSSVLRSELSMQSEQLLKNLNSYIGEKVLDKIVLR